jgi:hypothetical protein
MPNWLFNMEVIVWTFIISLWGHKQVSSKANIQAYQGPFLSEKSLIDTPTSCEVNSHSCMLDSPVYGVDGRLAFLVVKRHGSPLLALASSLTQKATPQI